jgi:hypothetical protein
MQRLQRGEAAGEGGTGDADIISGGGGVKGGAVGRWRTGEAATAAVLA